MKRFTIAIIVLLASSFIWGATLISEGFSTTSLPTGWSGDVYFNSAANHGTLTGANGAGFNASLKYLQLPSVNSAGILTFWTKGSSSTSQISYRVMKSVGGGAFSTIADYPKPHNATWTQRTVTINDASSNIVLKIESYDRTGNSIYLDDVVLTDYSAGTPTITVTGTLTAFSTTTGTASAYQSYKVSGTNLTNDIVVNAPTSFELCKTSGGTYTASLTFAQSSGSVAEQDVFVRLAASASPGTPSGNITHTTGATQVDKAVSGTVYKTAPSNHVSGFTASLGTPSYSAVTLTWTDAAKVTPDGYLIKGSDIGYSSIDDPEDGTAEANGTLIRNVPQGNQTYTFTDLAELTTYYFKIFPYTNSGTNILYKSDGTIPQDDATTTAAPPQYLVNFEGTGETKTAYASGSVTLSGLSWDMTEALIGVDASDWKVGARSARMRGYGTSSITMLADKTTGAGNVSFKYRRYGTDPQVDWKVEYSVDSGVNWTQLGSSFTAPASDVVQTFSEDLNIAGNVRIRIKRATETGTVNSRLNIDDLIIMHYPIYDYPAGTPVDVGGGVTITVTGGNANNGSGSIPSIPNTNTTYTGFTFLLDNAISNWTITILTDALFGAYYQGGSWHVVSGNGTQVVLNITLAGGKAEEEIPVILGDLDPTLPVELSSFTATLTAQNTVNIMWVTQTETNVNGYYVYRGISSELNTAAAVSSLIGATNTSQQQVYQFTDTEVFEPGTYYYWLQVQDLDGSIQFHGPTTIYFDNGGNNSTPVIPKVTELKSIYPNPFNPNTTINYSLAKAETVDFVIYNNRGQIVRSFNEGNKGIGNHNLRWNGEDQYGRPCSTGVYYIKMNAGKDSFIRKAVLMK